MKLNQTFRLIKNVISNKINKKREGKRKMNYIILAIITIFLLYLIYFYNETTKLNNKSKRSFFNNGHILEKKVGFNT